jgi:hypothetical protein
VSSLELSVKLIAVTIITATSCCRLGGKSTITSRSWVSSFCSVAQSVVLGSRYYNDSTSTNLEIEGIAIPRVSGQFREGPCALSGMHRTAFLQIYNNEGFGAHFEVVDSR